MNPERIPELFGAVVKVWPVPVPHKHTQGFNFFYHKQIRFSVDWSVKWYDRGKGPDLFQIVLVLQLEFYTCNVLVAIKRTNWRTKIGRTISKEFSDYYFTRFSAEQRRKSIQTKAQVPWRRLRKTEEGCIDETSTNLRRAGRSQLAQVGRK